jgi:DNA polymerase elongation subunit (family B)
MLRSGFAAPKILCFDMEARPLGWFGGDFTHKEITIISSAWVTDPEGTMETHALSKKDGSGLKMVEAFIKRYDEADIVMGHYIRGFDLPLLNAAAFDLGLRPISDKRSQDTKGDLFKLGGLSKSMENMGGLLGLTHPKVNMNAQNWRLANRLLPDGVEYAIVRCEGDVLENVELWNKLRTRGYLSPPKIWTPSASGSQPKYHA